MCLNEEFIELKKQKKKKNKHGELFNEWSDRRTTAISKMADKLTRKLSHPNQC